jgi:hypothetical protein
MTTATILPSPLVGTWKLVSFQFEVEGGHERRDVYDEHPNGFLIVTGERRMMALLTAGDRTRVARIGALFDRMMAYSGRYRVQGASCLGGH